VLALGAIVSYWITWIPSEQVWRRGRATMYATLIAFGMAESAALVAFVVMRGVRFGVPAAGIRRGSEAASIAFIALPIALGAERLVSIVRTLRWRRDGVSHSETRDGVVRKPSY
jgi:hypothetical protein